MHKLPIISFLLLFSWQFAVAGNNDGDSSAISSIDFVSFSAILSSKVIHFSWDINSESRGDRFEIEKSIDQQEWTLLTSVESLESHKERHTYKISEINLPEAAFEFFRIVRVDRDGARTVLDVVNINQPILHDIWLLNVKGKFNKLMYVSFDSMICSEAEMKLLDPKGNLIRVQKIHVSTGHNREEVVIKNLAAGSYTIVILDEFGNRIERLITIGGHINDQKTKF